MKGVIIVIEFQKRELPHEHILTILDRTNNMTADKIKNMQQQIYQVKMIISKTGKMSHLLCYIIHVVT